MTVSTISGIVVTLLVTALVIIKTKGRNEVDEVIPEEG